MKIFKNKKVFDLIISMDKNNVISCKNGLPWNIPFNLIKFNELTKGHIVIMGRITFESIYGYLPERDNIVLSRNKNYKPDFCLVANSFNKAIQLGYKIKKASSNKKKLFVIGGVSVYQQAFPLSEGIYWTEIHHEFDVLEPIYFTNSSSFHLININSEYNASKKNNLYTSTFYCFLNMAQRRNAT